MKTNLSYKTALIAVCALALSPAALFAGKAAQATEERGIIKSVDLKTHEIVVTEHKTKADGTFQWNDQTKFTEQGRTVKPETVKAGMKAQLTYAARPGTPMLERVQLSPAKAQKHSSWPRTFHKKI